MTRNRSRPGYTLVEVLVASVIALLVMGALYAAMRQQMRLAEESRQLVQRDTLIRSVVNRFRLDVQATLTPIAAQQIASAEGGDADALAGLVGGDAGGDPLAGMTGGGEGEGEDALAGLDELLGGGAALAFTAGVVGDAEQLTVYVSRPAVDADGRPTSGEVGTSDLREVTYFMPTTGSETGLARRERVWVTADDGGVTDDDGVRSEADYIIAPEVKTLSFEYWDGSAWATEWDGNLPGPDGKTAQGPPLAVAVILGFEFPVADGEPGEVERIERRVVIALPASPGTAGADPTLTEGG